MPLSAALKRLFITYVLTILVFGSVGKNEKWPISFKDWKGKEAVWKRNTHLGETRFSYKCRVDAFSVGDAHYHPWLWAVEGLGLCRR